MWFPTKDFVLMLYIKSTGINPPVIIKSGILGTLDQVRFGRPFHPNNSLLERGALIYRNFCQEHYFEDGNKRIAQELTFIFLLHNNIFIDTSDQAFYEFTMRVADESENVDYEEILQWLKSNTSTIFI